MIRIVLAFLLLSSLLYQTNAILASESKPESAAFWLGEWHYEEFWPHLTGEVHDGVIYVLRINRDGRDGKDLAINLDIDGYMSLARIRAIGRINANKLQIIFASFREEGMRGQNYRKGDILLELERQGVKTITRWEKLKPELDEHLKPNVYFVKKRQP
jgi:hypothetical protein